VEEKNDRFPLKGGMFRDVGTTVAPCCHCEVDHGTASVWETESGVVEPYWHSHTSAYVQPQINDIIENILDPYRRIKIILWR
jgi:hypothetical protein